MSSARSANNKEKNTTLNSNLQSPLRIYSLLGGSIDSLSTGVSSMPATTHMHPTPPIKPQSNKDSIQDRKNNR